MAAELAQFDLEIVSRSEARERSKGKGQNFLVRRTLLFLADLFTDLSIVLVLLALCPTNNRKEHLARHLCQRNHAVCGGISRKETEWLITRETRSKISSVFREYEFLICIFFSKEKTLPLLFRSFVRSFPSRRERSFIVIRGFNLPSFLPSFAFSLKNHFPSNLITPLLKKKELSRLFLDTIKYVVNVIYTLTLRKFFNILHNTFTSTYVTAGV